ncbi:MULTISPECIES: bifunctional protein-serine/threonine kinase/phosphatase [Methylomonas]|uniref:Protein kinase n=2 Tax=Methylomonas TaxID=416 RepID=A0A126T3G7_9GAMM|nr:MULTISPECIES: bifunctional protein-serine/threonine kinase/phosphatase [Methylomonas]AMK76636.1 protein kinase [Methylomonas denitrificans]OAH96292.1 protein kinase [Methylomonas methanica]TCV73154.1 serine/threonine protein phosphatase PrpC [Methylomonas methanica]
MAKALSIRIGSHSDKGVKSENEDFWGAVIPAEPQLTLKGIVLGIADGMSGSEAGKEASHCCITAFLEDYYSTPDSWSVAKAGQKILSATNSWLHSQGQMRYSSVKGMVSTLSVLIVKSNTAHILHVGDSRIYLWRQNVLEQLTRDHRLWVSDDKSYLNRAMGIEPHLEVDYKSLTVEKNDLFLMTTDGLHDFVDEKALKTLLSGEGELDDLADTLVKTALDNGSDDNVTCQLVRIDDLPRLREDEILRHQGHLPFPPPLEPGVLLDGYRIEAELHASKRTQIYRAFDTLHDRQVILKTPSVLYNDDTHYIEHFLHEEWAGKRINHDNVLKILESDRAKSCLYYVTEFIKGQTLRDWMTDNPKPEIKRVRALIEQVAKGLRAFHRMEMLHQDLKPENIMITNEGIVKIIDFGSVKIAGIAEITPLDHGIQENILGTLNYTAPEYHLGQRGSVKSDLFSLGVICYEMFNGSLPFGDLPEKPNRNNLERLGYIPSIRCNNMVPIWIDGALKKATQLLPQFRYEELSEFLHDLTTPNPQFLKAEDRIPLIERNPLLFWKCSTLIFFVCSVVLALTLLSQR